MGASKELAKLLSRFVPQRIISVDDRAEWRHHPHWLTRHWPCDSSTTMAIFRDEPSTWQQLDYRLLQNSPIAMYFRADVLTEDTAWLSARGYRIDPLDCSGWTTEAIAHAALSTALEFPDYYGRNLDAFNDCLGDVDVPEDAGRVLVFVRYDVPAAAMRSFAAALLDIIAAQARYKMLLGRRLFALVQSDDPRLEFEPVGACPVIWNPREWLNTKRGL